MLHNISLHCEIQLYSNYLKCDFFLSSVHSEMGLATPAVNAQARVDLQAETVLQGKLG